MSRLHLWPPVGPDAGACQAWRRSFSTCGTYLAGPKPALWPGGPGLNVQGAAGQMNVRDGAINVNVNVHADVAPLMMGGAAAAAAAGNPLLRLLLLLEGRRGPAAAATTTGAGSNARDS